MICKNCDTSFEGNFCSNCGQKAATHHIDHRFIFHEIPHAILHIDKGIFYTIKEFTLRPGRAYLDYAKGKRVKQFSPIAYIIILSSVYLLLRNFVWHVYAGEEVSIADSFAGKLRQFQYIGFMFLASTPVFALFSWWFSGKKSGLNYWEFLVGYTFFLGHTIFILSVFMLVRLPFPQTMLSAIFDTVVAIVALGYLFFCSYQLLTKFYPNKAILTAKAAGALILSISTSCSIYIGFVLLLERF